MSSYKIDLVLITSTLLILFSMLPHLTWLVLVLAVATILTGLGFTWKIDKIILFHHNRLHVSFNIQSHDEYTVCVKGPIQRSIRRFQPRRGPAPGPGFGGGGPRRPPRPSPRPSRPGSPRPGRPRPIPRAGRRNYRMVHGTSAEAHAIRLHNRQVSLRYRDRLQRQDPQSRSETLLITSRESTISPDAEQRFISAVNREMNVINVETDNSE